CCKLVCQNIIGDRLGACSSHTLYSIFIPAYSSAVISGCLYQHGGTTAVGNRYSLISQSTHARSPRQAAGSSDSRISRDPTPNQVGALSQTRLFRSTRPHKVQDSASPLPADASTWGQIPDLRTRYTPSQQSSPRYQKNSAPVHHQANV